MPRSAIPLVATCAAAGALVAPGEAHALGPVGIEAGAKVGAGTTAIDESFNPRGFGLGARGGISIFNVYAGVAGVYYFGSNQTFPATNIKSNIHSAVYGFEAGYSIKLLGLLTLRPQVGFGNDELSSSASFIAGSGPTSSTSNGYFYLEPAVVVLVTLGIVYVGADIGALMLPAGPASNSAAESCTGPVKDCHSFDVSLTAHGQVGVSF
jgi:hypothetical protein